MLSAFILSRGSYPAMPLARQPIYQCSVNPGPLVLGTNPIKLPTPTTDRDQTVSRRFEPSSRTTLIGEQPNPWKVLHVNSWTRSACYPQGSFYPLSYGPSIRDRKIIMSDFRPCSSCRTRSQASLCHCTRGTISNRAEDTLERLRYSLGGDRPSQTTRLPLSAGS